MGYWYYKTFQVVAQVRKGAKDFLLDGSKRNADLVIKLSTLVLFFVFGYSGIVSQSLYEVLVGRAKIWGDVLAACIVLIYWVCAPFAYAMANHRLGISSVLKGKPGTRASKSGTPEATNPRNLMGTDGSNNNMSGKVGSQLSKGTSRIEGSAEENNGTGDVFFNFDPLPVSPETEQNSPDDPSLVGQRSTGAIELEVLRPHNGSKEEDENADRHHPMKGEGSALLFSFHTIPSSPKSPRDLSGDDLSVASTPHTNPSPLPSAKYSDSHSSQITPSQYQNSHHGSLANSQTSSSNHSHPPLVIPSSVSISMFPELSSSPSHSHASGGGGGGGGSGYQRVHSSTVDEDPDFTSRQIFNPFVATPSSTPTITTRTIQTHTPTMTPQAVPPSPPLSPLHSPSAEPSPLASPSFLPPDISPRSPQEDVSPTNSP
jgi:hypothetical protein